MPHGLLQSFFVEHEAGSEHPKRAAAQGRKNGRRGAGGECVEHCGSTKRAAMRSVFVYVLEYETIATCIQKNTPSGGHILNIC